MASTAQNASAEVKPFFGPARPPTTSTSSDAQPPSSTARSKIVLLSLEREPWIEDICQNIFVELKARADVIEITGAAAASTFFTTDTSTRTVLVTDAALTRKKYKKQRTEAVQFVRNGGTLVFGLNFPNFSRPPDFKTMFQAFSLPWESGDYHRTEFSVNNSFSAFETHHLSPRYSQKALHLQNVARQDAVYLPTASSHTQSHVFAPSPVGDRSQTPAAFGAYGDGKVGYLGDVNSEAETTAVVLAMCGLIS